MLLSRPHQCCFLNYSHILLLTWSACHEPATITTGSPPAPSLIIVINALSYVFLEDSESVMTI